MGFDSGTVAFIASLLVGLAFLVAGLSKVRNRTSFAGSVEALGLLPPQGRELVVVGLPLVEIALGLTIVTGLAVTLSLAVAVAMLAGFTLATYLGFGPGKRFDCGCFGPLLGATDFRGVALRNGGLTALAAVGLVFTPAGWSLTSAVLAGISVAVLVLAFSITRAISSWGDHGAAPANLGRRTLLARSAQLAGAAALVSAFGGLIKASPAEAACQACKTCSPEVIFIACSGGCCAGFWVRDTKYCPPYCYSCSAWRIEEYCGQFQCC